ncbi:rRNA adenine N-6-methyltransferase family protein [Nocardia sp. CC227C]|uniref:rRNA adenine N-6-methyltransferase family protein n=1 Tax=Nocardia sp. CC227C TaxID=3044562 RepID=UPI00278C8BD4|nr:rRNA adenine N-6-methyltransferase family protein [Nocardia sp. CC227C]
MTNTRSNRPAGSDTFAVNPELLATIGDLPFSLSSDVLDQHLLVSTEVVDCIVDAADVSASDVVADVGAGLGTITVGLMQRARRVIAIEKDKRFESELRSISKRCSKVDVRLEDFLESDLTGVQKIVANPPFGLLEPMLKQLPLHPQIQRIVLILGSRSARKLLACPGDSGFTRLALLAHAYY